MTERNRSVERPFTHPCGVAAPHDIWLMAGFGINGEPYDRTERSAGPEQGIYNRCLLWAMSRGLKGAEAVIAAAAEVDRRREAHEWRQVLGALASAGPPVTALAAAIKEMFAKR